MADMTPDQLQNVARSFAKMPPHMNPIRNPNARARMPQHLQPHISAIASNPQLAAVATSAAAPAASASPAMAPTPTGGLSNQSAFEAVAANQSQYHRLPNVRHQVLGCASVVFAAAGVATAAFTPQVPFKGNRVIFPSATLAGTTISNMLVGTRPQYAAASTEPFDLFEEQSTAGTWDLDMCEVGQKITCSVTVTGATTVNACIVGEVHDGKAYPSLQSGLKRAAFTSTGTVAAGASATFQVAPQVRFKSRKLVLDDSTAKFFNITSFLVGITPQTISGDPVPAAAFTELAQDVWLDCDEAYIGNSISLTVTNFDAAAHAIGGAFLGDVDPRDLVAGSYA